MASSLVHNALTAANHAFPATFLQRAKYDDVAALLALFVGGFAYVSRGSLWDRPDPYHHKLFEKPEQRASVLGSVQRIDNLEKRLEADSCDMAILWASQSGTSERLAGRLAKDLRRNFNARALPLDISDITPASLMEISKSRLVIFMASTFGEGDPSDNLRQMWSWLHTSRNCSLSNVRFLAFGLGNSNYKHYNHVIDVVVDELLDRGARQLLETGRADDAAGETEEHFLEWKQKVFELFQTTLGYERLSTHYEPCIKITDDDSVTGTDLCLGAPYVNKTVAAKMKPAPLPVLRSSNLLQQSTDRKCLHLEIDLSQNANLKYKTGDHLAVWPINPALEVEILLKGLGLEYRRTTPLRITSLDNSATHIPSPTTLEAVLQCYLEICSLMSRESVGLLVAYAPTKAALDFLKAVSQDKTCYAEYSRARYLNLGRLLEAACPTPGAWNTVPLSLILEVLPAMQPRFYSISSSSIVSPRQVAITVAVSDTSNHTSPDGVIGLASNYLMTADGASHSAGLTYSRILPNCQTYAAVRKSTFKLPLMASAPVVMVGAGTGVAPFRAFVQERARLKSMGRDVGTTRLFFGCRNASQDLVYADDFATWEQTLDGCFSMTTAYSRPHNREEKRYVQDAMLQDAEAVYKLLVEENAYFYICGSAAMARDVSAALARIISAREGWGDDEMNSFADRQKRTKRWLQDVWG